MSGNHCTALYLATRVATLPRASATGIWRHGTDTNQVLPIPDKLLQYLVVGKDDLGHRFGPLSILRLAAVAADRLALWDAVNTFLEP